MEIKKTIVLNETLNKYLNISLKEQKAKTWEKENRNAIISTIEW